MARGPLREIGVESFDHEGSRRLAPIGGAARKRRLHAGTRAGCPQLVDDEITVLARIRHPCIAPNVQHDRGRGPDDRRAGDPAQVSVRMRRLEPRDELGHRRPPILGAQRQPAEHDLS
jgi:hypothetical protein